MRTTFRSGAWGRFVVAEVVCWELPMDGGAFPRLWPELGDIFSLIMEDNVWGSIDLFVVTGPFLVVVLGGDMPRNRASSTFARHKISQTNPK